MTRSEETSWSAADEVDFVRAVASSLGISEQSIVDWCNFYNSNYSAYGNEVYRRVETRVAHWLNFRRQGWFDRRLNAALERCKDFDLVVDLGFSVPYAYTRKELIRTESPKFVFVDDQKSAKDFYDMLVRMYGWESAAVRDRVILEDISTETGVGHIVGAVTEVAPRSVLIVASEVIEHLASDELCWALMSRLRAVSSIDRMMVYVTLPIGQKIPSHNLEFLRIDDALGYLNAHVGVVRADVLVPPREAPHTSYLTGCVCVLGEL